MRALAAATIIALAISACAQTPEALRPTETPFATSSEAPTIAPETPSPTLSPTPAPTEVPAPAPTPMPHPTTRLAGEQMYVYYFEARRQFSIFPPTPQIDFDEAADTVGDSYYKGLNLSVQPIFAVREDFKMTPRTAYHEIGHAYQDLLQHRFPGVDVMAQYWTFRGFPGTWQDAAKSAQAQQYFQAQWKFSPSESWAEAFSVAMVGGGQEKTMEYGRTLNPTAMKAFFKSFTAAAP